MYLTFFYTTTMDSTASELPDLDSEARMELAVAYFRAHPEQSIRKLSKAFSLQRLTLTHQLNGR